MKKNWMKGVSTIKSSSTWKRVAGIALGGLAAGVGVGVAGKITPNSVGRTGKYAAGGAVAAAVAIGCFAFDFENAGIGAAAITVNQALNSGTMLIFDKSIAELTA